MLNKILVFLVGVVVVLLGVLALFSANEYLMSLALVKLIHISFLFIRTFA